MSDDYGNFPKKWAKILNDMADEDWKGSADSASSEELKAIIVKSTKLITNTEKDKDADNDLKTLKEQLKMAMSTYTDIIKLEEAKKRYCVYLLNSQGK